jgi:hypothetical protein
MNKITARQIYRRAVESGRLVPPDSCSRCGSTDRAIHGHHTDYDRPLDVVWLCWKCHCEEHGGIFMRKKLDSQILVRVDDEVKAVLKEAASRQGRTLGNVVRRIIDAHLGRLVIPDPPGLDMRRPLGNPLLGVAADEPGPVGGGQRA